MQKEVWHLNTQAVAVSCHPMLNLLLNIISVLTLPTAGILTSAPSDTHPQPQDLGHQVHGHSVTQDQPDYRHIDPQPADYYQYIDPKLTVLGHQVHGHVTQDQPDYYQYIDPKLTVLGVDPILSHAHAPETEGVDPTLSHAHTPETEGADHTNHQSTDHDLPPHETQVGPETIEPFEDESEMYVFTYLESLYLIELTVQSSCLYTSLRR